MSSLRNAVKRKTHKERSQPADRARLGLLEKHKDYVLRAKDFNKKKARLHALQTKAAFKNPDEFYFKMNKKDTKGGVHTIASDNYIPDDVVKVMKTQDLAYVINKKNQDRKKAEKLKEQLHFLVDQPLNKHTVFLDSKREVAEFDAQTHFDTAPELVEQAYNRPRMSTLEKQRLQAKTDDPRFIKKLLKKRGRAYQELHDRTARAAKLGTAASRLELERNLAGKGKKRKIKDAEGGAPAVYKWKRERKK